MCYLTAMDKNKSLEDLDIELKANFKRIAHAACLEAALVYGVMTSAKTDSAPDLLHQVAIGMVPILAGLAFRAGSTALERHRLNNHIERMFP